MPTSLPKDKSSSANANAAAKNPAASSSAAIRQIGFLPLLAVFFGYTCGGPFGYEEIFKGSGPGMA
ncbi:MAG TPA: hypothetical protein VN745_10990, partial [Verrucomicrobiae bacterium]|nr:hypothetical protein [Verrucomicrobiae bacterium]